MGECIYTFLKNRERSINVKIQKRFDIHKLYYVLFMFVIYNEYK